MGEKSVKVLFKVLKGPHEKHILKKNNYFAAVWLKF